MPLVPEAIPLQKRRAPLWLLILVLVVLPPVGLFGWSFHRPVLIRGGCWRNAGFGRIYSDPGGASWTNTLYFGGGYLKILGGRQTGWYVWYWFWP
jgi:hypothetical protein